MIGFYVHHHGRGHLARTQVILQHLTSPASILTSTALDGAQVGEASVIQLPLDTHDGPSPATFHYAPLGSRGLRARMASIAAWIEEQDPTLLVVDVSVEVAVYARLMGLPVVVVRQHGDRRDSPHLLGYDMAVSLLAPYPESVEDPTTPPEVRAKTCYTGFFSRADGRQLLRREARRLLHIGQRERLVVVLNGAGGPGRSYGDVRSAAAATPRWRWLLVGGGSATDLAPGWVTDPFCYLRAADVVVTAAGHNAVSEALAADRPVICIPEARPFGEQVAKAEALDREGVAVINDGWPAPHAWEELLRRALALDPARRRRLCDGKGAIRAATHLQSVAQGPLR